MTGIYFKDCGASESVDALTGGPLGDTVFKCQQCSARYSETSVLLLSEENDGRCLSCGRQSVLLESNQEAL